jgi:hypothetical protein
MNDLQQSSTAQPLVFLMVDSTDHITGKTGLSPTVTLSKNGATFASPAGAVTEIGNGWYKVAGNATDTNTLGPLVLHATGTAADPVDVLYSVVAYNPQDSVRMGMTSLPNAAAEASGGIITRGTGTGQLSVSSGQVILQAGTGTGQLDFTSGVLKSNPVQINGTSIAGTGTRVADGFVAFLNVASPVLTLASVNQTGDSYARIGVNGVGLSAIQLPSNGLANVTTWTVALTGNITGNLSGSVGSVTGLTAADVGAIKTKTDQLTFTVTNQVDSNALTGGGGLDAAGVRAAIGLASANLDTQIATLATGSNLSTVSTNVSAIKAKTDNLPAAPAATGDIPTAVQNADALLKRDWTAVSGEADYSMLNAGRALRCKWDDGLTTADTYTVFKEDGIATAWFRTVTHNPAAEPVTGAS